MTDADIDALQTSGLHRATPYMIVGVAQSQFSIARHYGGIRYQGIYYRYDHAANQLIREDVARWIKSRARVLGAAEPARQEALF